MNLKPEKFSVLGEYKVKNIRGKLHCNAVSVAPFETYRIVNISASVTNSGNTGYLLQHS